MIYAAYQGDEFLIVDTVDKVSNYLDVSINTVKFYASEAYKKRIENRKNAVLCIKFKEEQE